MEDNTKNPISEENAPKTEASNQAKEAAIPKVTSPESSKKKSIITNIVAAILMLIFIFLVVYILFTQYLSSGKKNSHTTTTTTSSAVTSTTLVSDDPSDNSDGTDDNNDSEIISVDDEFDNYVNHEFGFSVNFLKNNLGYECYWDDQDGDHSFRLRQGGTYPNRIFEDLENKAIFISQEYSYQLSDSSQVGGIYYFAKCQKVNTTLADLNSGISENFSLWKFVYDDGVAEDDIDTFIKSVAGEGCVKANKVLSSQAGVYDIKIGNEPALHLDPAIDPQDCEIGGLYELKYYQSEEKIVYWSVGQSCSFMDENEVCRDQEMIDSFKFE